MTKLFVPIGHSTMRMKDIAPIHNSAFSKNLYLWMKNEGHEYRDGGVAESVYRVKPNSKMSEDYGVGTLFIGCYYNQYEGDKDFSGIILNGVLCNGTKAGRFCYTNAINSFELVEGFWDQYLQVGRCAIDTQHEQHFRGIERYSITGDVRTCLWCGVKHSLVKTPRTIIEESWELA